MQDWFAHQDVVPRDAAAAIIMAPGGASAHEILLARRNKKLAFMGGHHVFPGGRMDDADHAGEVSNAPDPETARGVFAAAREVFEETGLLCVRRTPDIGLLRDLRCRMTKGELPFGEVLRAAGAALDAQDFTPAGIWVTPPFSPIRYRTRYYVYRHEGPRYEEVEPGDGEIVGLDWLTAHEARRRWHLGEIRLSTPIAFVLQHLARLSFEESLPWLHKTPGTNHAKPNRFELRRGMHLIPVRSATLPPATHTNCVVVGEDELLVVDPGAEDEAELEHLFEHIDHLLALRGRVTAVLLSHSHPDHTGGAARLAERYNAPIWAHPETARQVALPVSRHLADGDIIRLAGDPDWEVLCLHTPGHDPGHLALLERSTRTLLAGDLVANPGTIVISPDFEGDMNLYLESLNRVIGEDFNFMIPAHGMPFWMQNAKEVLSDLVAHRLEREEKILRAIDAGASTRREVIEQAYADTPREAWPIADHQLRAHLARLNLALEP